MSVTPTDLTGTERAVLLVLMAQARPVPNADLLAYGPTMDKRSRDKLNTLDLIESDRVGGRYIHELTDRGFAAASIHGDLGQGAPGLLTELAEVLTCAGSGALGGDGGDDLALHRHSHPAGQQQHRPGDEDRPDRPVRQDFGRAEAVRRHRHEQQRQHPPQGVAGDGRADGAGIGGGGGRGGGHDTCPLLWSA